MATISAKRITVAEYLTHQINICDKSQKEIAVEVGYDKANVITMFKQGSTKLPINKVPIFAKALGVDPVHLLRIVMQEYAPDAWQVFEELLGTRMTSEDDRRILGIVHQHSKGWSVAPRTETDEAELAKLVTSWAKREEAMADAAMERVARR
ncbi:MAG: hypothetical protein WBX11_16985 [Thiobacillaceae bacterium]